MKKLTNDILKSELAKVEPENTTIEVELNSDSYEIEISKFISFVDMASFVSEVVNTVFIDGSYNPVIRNYAIESNVLRYYTNLKDEFDIDEILKLEIRTNITDSVIESIDPTQFDEICECIDKEIEVRNMKLNSATVIDNAAESFAKFMDTLNTKLAESNIPTIAKELFPSLTSENIMEIIKMAKPATKTKNIKVKK